MSDIYQRPTIEGPRYVDDHHAMITKIKKIGMTINVPEDEADAVLAQAQVLMDALVVYRDRNRKYRDNWKRMGWRGVLIRIRERSERLWDQLWANPTDSPDLDDALDLINFAAFLVRAAKGEATHGGEWW